jgi:hypothetical protein
MRRRPIKTDFRISIHFVEVHFAPTRCLYTSTRLTAEREVAEFGPRLPDPAIKHASRARGTCKYDAADMLAMAFRLATAAARAEM